MQPLNDWVPASTSPSSAGGPPGLPPSGPPPKTLPHVLEADDIERLLDNCGNIRDQALILTLWGTGARISEICTASWNDLHNNALKVMGKGKRERYCVVPPRAWAMLMRWKFSRGGFLGDDTIFKIKRRGAYKLLKRIAEQAGVAGVHPHAFRHTCATMLVQNGNDIRWVQAYLGHSSIRSTQLYTHVAIDGLKAIAATHPMETR